MFHKVPYRHRVSQVMDITHKSERIRVSNDDPQHRDGANSINAFKGSRDAVEGQISASVSVYGEATKKSC